MNTNNDDTTTLQELASSRRSRTATPVLLLGSHIPKSSQVVSLNGPVTIGRDRRPVDDVRAQDTEVILRTDRMLSRPHLRIAKAANRWTAEDLGSKNGTFVDGRRIETPTPLSDGSIVLFGSHAAVFRLASEPELAAVQKEAANPFGPVATLSPSLASTLSGLRQLAIGGHNFLFVGETGVGKEVYARAVHAASGRKGEFVAINCAALPAELAESELFGYARGAHSTATRAKSGLVEMADKGTLLLDEIGEMDPRLQVKLFRFLQDGQVLALGATRTRPLDVVVMAATSQGATSVRADLVGRLGAEPVTIPPLRDRAEDIGALVAYFAGPAFAGAAAADVMEPAAFRALCVHAWPRNVRELGEVVKRALALADGRKIRVGDLPGGVRESLEAGPRVTAARKWRPAPSRIQLERLLREHRGNISGVAKALDRQWAVVHRWLRQHDLKADQFRG
jgi:transcriptional regulator with PAS, ATPase and Fis domain